MTNAAQKQPVLNVRDYLTRGFAVLPIHRATAGVCSCGKAACSAPGKHPLTKNGSRDASLSRIDLVHWSQENPGCNWAVATGLPLPEGGYLVVLDVDPRNNGDHSLAELEEKHGELPATLVQATGGGGWHYLFRTTEPVANSILAPGLETKGVGGYVVVEPSIHPSGRTYSWATPLSHAIADLPTWVVTQSPRSRPEYLENDPLSTFLGRVAEHMGWLGDYLGNGKRACKCPWLEEHSRPLWHTRDSGTVILPPRTGDNLGGFACLHAHCQGKGVSDFLAAASDSAKDYARTFFAAPAAPPAASGGGNAPPSAGPQPTGARLTPADLVGAVTKDGDWKISPVEANAVHILCRDPDWVGVLQYDEMRGTAVAARQPPFSTPWGAQYPRDWTDADDLSTLGWLQQGPYAAQWSDTRVRNAIHVAAHRVPVNELYDYLNGLQWDGTQRVDTWLTQYMGTVDTPYVRAVGRMWLISAVARALDPGAKADYVLVMEGKTSLGKSQALEILASTRFYMSDLGNLASEKAAAERIRSKWIIEDAEMTAMMGVDSHVSKSFITRREDNYRESYARRAQSFKRRCVFAATVNEFSYLTDPTGNRRYWPVRVLSVDKATLVRDRDQLWAEACVLYRAGDPWWPVDQLTVDLCEGEQERRRIVDPWERALDLSSVKRFSGFGAIYAKLGIEASKQTHETERRLAKVLQRLGYDTLVENGMTVWVRKP